MTAIVVFAIEANVDEVIGLVVVGTKVLVIILVVGFEVKVPIVAIVVFIIVAIVLVVVGVVIIDGDIGTDGSLGQGSSNGLPNIASKTQAINEPEVNPTFQKNK